MDGLIFLTGNMQNPAIQEKFCLQLTYVNSAIMFGKMYRNGRETFNAIPNNKRQGNRVVYGSLYFEKHFEHYIRVLDAMHDCSLSLIGKNHTLDKQHRVLHDVTTLSFESISNLMDLRYTEDATTQAYVYLANIKHPKIAKKINDENNVYRIQSGIHKAFVSQWEATHG